MRKRCPRERASASAASIFSHTTVRASRLRTTAPYVSSNCTSVSAVPQQPRSRSSPLSRSDAGRMVSSGRKVARPPSVRRRYSMHALPSSAEPTTIDDADAPSAVSIAVTKRFSVERSAETGPCTPESLPRPACCMTDLTDRAKPS